MSGKIIVIEGTECSGKETQTKLLEKKLKQLGKQCIRFDFPMYDTPTGKIVGGAIRGKAEMGPKMFEDCGAAVDPHVICLYYAADRKYNMPMIEDYLKKDYYVILDRYTTSNLAHQGSKIKEKDDRFNMYQWIDKLEYWLLKLPKPDKTIYLHLPYEYKNSLRKTDSKEKLNDNIKQTEEAYLELSELYNWDIVECVRNGKIRSVEEINEEILNIIKDI